MTRSIHLQKRKELDQHLYTLKYMYSALTDLLSLPSAQFPRGCAHHAADGGPGEDETQHGGAGIQARLEEAVEGPGRKGRD